MESLDDCTTHRVFGCHSGLRRRDRGYHDLGRQPDYVVIAEKLTPQKSNEAVGILETENIRYI
jgi:hypothetical protein